MKSNIKSNYEKIKENNIKSGYRPPVIYKGGIKPICKPNSRPAEIDQEDIDFFIEINKDYQTDNRNE